MKLFFNPTYVSAGYHSDTTRKAAWIVDSLRSSLVPEIEICSPASVQEEDLLRVHDAGYVRAVRSGDPRSLAESQGFFWDSALWGSVCASTGGAVAAALTALRDGVAGSLSSGLHHARQARGEGFCTFNGIALAARAALGAGARKVLVLDFDAHCGGGTHSLIVDDLAVVHRDLSISPYDSYLPVPPHALTIVEEAEEYLPAVVEMIEGIQERFDLCIYNAGMDPYGWCGARALSGITFETLRRREELVFDWCRSRGMPIAFVIAGGYRGPGVDGKFLAELHRLTISAALGREVSTG